MVLVVGVLTGPGLGGTHEGRETPSVGEPVVPVRSVLLVEGVRSPRCQTTPGGPASGRAEILEVAGVPAREGRARREETPRETVVWGPGRIGVAGPRRPSTSDDGDETILRGVLGVTWSGRCPLFGVTSRQRPTASGRTSGSVEEEGLLRILGGLL